jgi:hypothetical protein
MEAGLGFCDVRVLLDTDDLLSTHYRVTGELSAHPRYFSEVAGYSWPASGWEREVALLLFIGDCSIMSLDKLGLMSEDTRTLRLLFGSVSKQIGGFGGTTIKKLWIMGGSAGPTAAFYGTGEFFGNFLISNFVGCEGTTAN